MLNSELINQIPFEFFKKYRDFIISGTHFKYVPNNIKLSRDPDKKTEVEKYLEIEIQFIIDLINELRGIESYFNFQNAVEKKSVEAQGYTLSDGTQVDAQIIEESVKLENVIKSRHITTLLADIFGIVYHKDVESMSSILRKIDGVVYFLKHIGSVPGIMKVFEVMLNVEVDVTCPKKGVIEIQLLGDTSSNIFSYIACSCVAPDCDPPKIVVQTAKAPEKGDTKIVNKVLYYDMTVEGYEQSVYNFIRRYIPAGRVVKFIDKNKKPINF